MTYHHGISITEEASGTRPIDEASTSVIGMVCTADDADADAFPLNKAVLITDINRFLAKAGASGTLAKALAAIAAQTGPALVVVRVSEGVVGNGLTAQEASDANVIGATSDNDYTGLQALLSAESQLKVRPRILGCPGLDSEPVAQALASVAAKLRGMAYVFAADAENESDAIAYRGEFDAREIMVIWPDFTGWAGQAVATALGTRARLDEQQGPHKSLSNVAVYGASGISKDVYFDLEDPSTGAGLLNASEVTTLVHRNGYRFWGSRTCSGEPMFAFEPSVRMNYLLQDTIAAGILWAIDKPLTRGLITDIVETIRAEQRKLVGKGWLIGANAWFDPARNSPEALAGGGLTISYDFTVPAPAEQIGLISIITGDYYSGVFAQLA